MDQAVVTSRRSVWR